MEIQHISYSGRSNRFLDSSVKENSFNEPEHFNQYELNIIDLTDKNIWKNDNNSYSYVNSLNDFKTLRELIDSSKDSKNTRNLIILPKNEILRYYKPSNSEHFFKSEQLKDIIDELQNNILGRLNLENIRLSFGVNKTKFDNEVIYSDFVIAGSSLYNSLKNSAGCVAVYDEDICYTTLYLEKYNQLMLLLKQIGWWKKDKSPIPEWMEGIYMFDDNSQNEAIKLAEEEIKEQKNIIETAKEKIKENNHYKSILYTQSEELVDVVKEILQKIFDADFSNFKDKKNEDFAFKLSNKYIIGEIKGVTSQVSTKHLSQLDNHLTSFSEENNVIEDDIIRLLIINSQRKIPVFERNPVDEKQIEKAKNKYGSLIIETKELLKMFEKFTRNEMTKDDCINEIKKTGIMKFD